ncbi:MAG: hypothetical protein ACXVZ1_11405 [Gaiellaceae bacterium]
MSSLRKIVIAAVAIGVVGLLPAVSLADSGGGVPANVQADITKTQGDVQSLHDTIVSDAAKIQSDVQGLQGTTDCTQARQTLKADWQQLRSDRVVGAGVVKQDLGQLHSDVKAARQAGQSDGIKALLQAMRTADKQLRADMRQAVQAAHVAAKGLRQTLRGHCAANKKSAPSDDGVASS